MYIFQRNLSFSFVGALSVLRGSELLGTWANAEARFCEALPLSLLSFSCLQLFKRYRYRYDTSFVIFKLVVEQIVEDTVQTWRSLPLLEWNTECCKALNSMHLHFSLMNQLLV